MYILVTNTDQAVIVSKDVINKSSVLRDHFEHDNSKNVFKLEYSKAIIDTLISKLQNNDMVTIVGENTELKKLCDQLNIPINQIDSLESRENTESTVTSIFFKGIVQHIFNSIWFKTNNQLISKYVESTVDQINNYEGIDMRDKKKEIITEEDFNKNYKPKPHEHNGMYVLKSNEKLCFSVKKIIMKPQMQIIVETYNIGKLIDQNIPDIYIDHFIFDAVVKKLMDKLDNTYYYEHFDRSRENVVSKFGGQDGYRYQRIIKIQQDYKNYTVRIKILYVNGSITD